MTLTCSKFFPFNVRSGREVFVFFESMVNLSAMVHNRMSFKLLCIDLNGTSFWRMGTNAAMPSA